MKSLIRSLSFIVLGAAFFVSSGCMQTENSNSLDDLIYGASGGRTGFGAVRFILMQNCANCHSYHTLTEDQMVAQGLLTVGSLDGSSIYFRLKGALSGPGPRNMPTNGALTQGDISIVADWVMAPP